MAGVGIATGPSLSGLLVGAVGWRAAFLSYVTVGLLILVGSVYISEPRASERPRVDWAGSLTLIAGVTLVVRDHRSRSGSVEDAARVTAGDLGDSGAASLADHFTAAWDITSWGVAALSLAATISVLVLLTRRRGSVGGAPKSSAAHSVDPFAAPPRPPS